MTRSASSFWVSLEIVEDAEEVEDDADDEEEDFLGTSSFMATTSMISSAFGLDGLFLDIGRSYSTASSSAYKHLNCDFIFYMTSEN